MDCRSPAELSRVEEFDGATGPIIEDFVCRQRQAIEELACRQAALLDLLQEERHAFTKKAGEELAELHRCFCRVHSPPAPSAQVAKEGLYQVIPQAEDAAAPQSKACAVAKQKLDPAPDPDEAEDELSAASKPVLTWRRCGTGIHRLVADPRFDLAMGGVVVLNMLLAFVKLELIGTENELMLEGDGSFEGTADDGATTYAQALVIFEAVYCVEVLLRLAAHGYKYFKSILNILDTVIVAIGCFTAVLALKDPLHSDVTNLSALRVIRFLKLTRIFRLAKIIRVAGHFHELRFIIRALVSSARGLMWSMVLIGGVVVAAGIFMAEIAKSFIENDANEMEKREWLYAHFGTASQAAWTMFECTFTSRWPIYAHVMVEDYNHFYIVLWILYVVFVNFATMRVVGALFLKQTMSEAHLDQDRMAMEHFRYKKKITKQIAELFSEADSSGDGLIDLEEFNLMMENDKVASMLAELDIYKEEAEALFSVLSADDGYMDYSEFLTAALKLKSTAKAMDAIQLQAMVGKISQNIGELKVQVTNEIVFGLKSLKLDLVAHDDPPAGTVGEHRGTEGQGDPSRLSSCCSAGMCPGDGVCPGDGAGKLLQLRSQNCVGAGSPRGRYAEATLRECGRAQARPAAGDARPCTSDSRISI